MVVENDGTANSNTAECTREAVVDSMVGGSGEGRSPVGPSEDWRECIEILAEIIFGHGLRIPTWRRGVAALEKLGITNVVETSDANR
jgi:hypothetical protein